MVVRHVWAINKNMENKNNLLKMGIFKLFWTHNRPQSINKGILEDEVHGKR